MRLQKARITAHELDMIVDDVRARYEYDDTIPSETDIAATILMEVSELASERVQLRGRQFMGRLRPRIRMASDGGMVLTWTPRGACEYCGMPRR